MAAVRGACRGLSSETGRQRACTAAAVSSRRPLGTAAVLRGPRPPPRCLAFGEIIFDRFVDTGEAVIGGAPLNFALVLRQLGVPRIGMVGALGEDDLGREARRLLRQGGIDDRLVRASPYGLPTGVVEVTLEAGGEPTYRIGENEAWDRIEIEEGILDRLGSEDGEPPGRSSRFGDAESEPDSHREGLELLYHGTTALCRSETNRRTLAKLRGTLKPLGGIVFYDVNLRAGLFQPEEVLEALGHSSVVKVNEEELARLEEWTEPRIGSYADLMRRFGFEKLAITFGARGAELHTKDGGFYRSCAPLPETHAVVDTVGAGDAFSASLAAGLLSNLDMQLTLDTACRVGREAVMQRGAQVVVPEGLTAIYTRKGAGLACNSSCSNEGHSSDDFALRNHREEPRARGQPLRPVQIQLALDTLSIPEAKKLLSELAKRKLMPEIVEVGTPFVLREGVSAVREIRAFIDNDASIAGVGVVAGGEGVKLLADLKIADAGQMEAAIAFDAGADIVTVLGAASDETIKSVVKEAQRRNASGDHPHSTEKKVMVDLIGHLGGPPSEVLKRARKAEELGADLVCFHTAFDEQLACPTASGFQGEEGMLVAARKGLQRSKLAIAGGVNPASFGREGFAPVFRPDVAVVGGYITGAKQPVDAMQRIRQSLSSAEKMWWSRSPDEGDPGSAPLPEEEKHHAKHGLPVAGAGPLLRPILEEITAELRRALLSVNVEAGQRLVEKIVAVKSTGGRVLAAGAGRSGNAMRGFAMRLMHLGVEAHFVGDTVTPPIAKGDLLLLGSGSGRTQSLVAAAGKASSIGASIALVTIGNDGAKPRSSSEQPPLEDRGPLSLESPIAKLADVVVHISAPSPKIPTADGSPLSGANRGVAAASTEHHLPSSVQPMGTLFEQSLGVLLDASVLLLMEKLDEDSASMFSRHANLE